MELSLSSQASPPPTSSSSLTRSPSKLLSSLNRTWRKAILIPPLLFALWILQDDEATGDLQDQQQNHHLAVHTALSRHPPSLRVFRSLLEIDLLLWGVAISLYIWSNSNIGTQVVGYLLFQSAALKDEDEYDKSVIDNVRNGHPGRYEPVLTEADELWGDSISDEIDDDQAKEPPTAVEDPTAGAGAEAGESSHSIDDGEDDDLLSDPMLLIEDLLEIPEPPTAISVANVALDLLLLILICLFCFTLSSAEGGLYIDGMQNISIFRFIAIIVAPIFPLILFCSVVVSVLHPWKSKRKEFWTIISYTLGAPMYHVTFRDGFIGDILTSSVRPMQDIAFTVFYLLSGLQGWWSQSYDLDHADLPLESNWILHTWILPMCMISPLWCRFLQNLRQCYESKQRWPYLGNALKYFVAAEVAMFGMFNPTKKQTFIWLSCFVIATLYQVWWDVFMDWELIKIDRAGIRLRPTRVYQYKWMYWMIFGINFVLRFCWTLSFLPPHYLNKAGVLSATFEGDLSTVLSPMIASAEIVRRTLWGLLRLELEAIKVARKDERLQGTWVDEEYKSCGDDDDEGQMNGDGVELQPMSMRQGLEPMKYTELASSGVWLSSDMSLLSDLQIFGELCLYCTIFAGLGIVAAAHRMTY